MIFTHAMSVDVQPIILAALQHHQAGRFDQASAGYRQALNANPNEPDALHLLGVVAHQTGDQPAAIQLILRAIELRPDAPEFYVNGANALRAAGQLDQAIQLLHRAVQLAPTLPEAQSNLAIALSDSGQLTAAIDHFKQALQLRPNFEAAMLGYAAALSRANRSDDAIACLRQTISAHSRSAAARVNLGNLLKQIGQLDEAIALLNEAVALNPHFAEAHNNLGNALFEAGLIEPAADAFRQAIHLRPRDPFMHSNLLLTLYRDPRATPRSILAAHRDWASLHAEPLTAAAPPLQNDRLPDRVLRVGYVASSFNNNAPARRFVVPLFRSHDHTKFQIVGYSDVAAPDATTHQLRGYCDEWHSTVGLSDAQLAGKIRADRIDILVDLMLHAGGHRLLAFARRPAPVQVTYLAYAGTSGMSAMDWRITDPHLDPPESDANYTERSMRIESYWCYESPPEAPAVGPLPAHTTGFVTFGCLNQFSKVRPETIDAWTVILRTLPNSRLLLRCDPGSHRAKVTEQFLKHDVQAARIEYLPAQPFRQYLDTYNRIDIALDPFPCNGGTTTCDALWMGAPVVTLAGQSAVARAGVSVLSHVGLPQLIARSVEEYIQIACNLASDLHTLSALRTQLRNQMQRSTLCNAERFTRGLEQAYRTMWRHWQGG